MATLLIYAVAKSIVQNQSILNENLRLDPCPLFSPLGASLLTLRLVIQFVHLLATTGSDPAWRARATHAPTLPTRSDIDTPFIVESRASRQTFTSALLEKASGAT